MIEQTLCRILTLLEVCLYLLDEYHSMLMLAHWLQPDQSQSLSKMHHQKHHFYQGLQQLHHLGLPQHRVLDRIIQNKMDKHQLSTKLGQKYSPTKILQNCPGPAKSCC